MSDHDPSWADIISTAVESGASNLHVSLPGRVERYDASKQLVDVKPLLKFADENERGERVPFSLPVVTNVPVVFPGAGGFRLTFPIKAGDTVLLVFADRSLDAWLSKGGEIDPNDPRIHNLSDAIAIPGLRPFSDPNTNASESSATLGADDGPQIVMSESGISIGGTGDEVLIEPAILGQSLLTWLNSHTHTAPIGPTTPPIVLATSALLATKVKVK